MRLRGRVFARRVFSIGTERSSTGRWGSLRMVPKKLRGEFPGGYGGAGCTGVLDGKFSGDH